jgi:hypothetical protein
LASVVGKLVSLEAALGKAVLVGTRLATIAIMAATNITEAAMRRINPWEQRITLSTEAMEALSEVLARLDEWNGYPIRCLHTRITLSSVLSKEATASLDRKIPARRLHDRRAVMASDASDLAVASYSIEGLLEFSLSDVLTFEEWGESSSHRELLAISRTLGFIKKSGSLRPTDWTTLWWFPDNQNVKKMIAKGSGKIKIIRQVLEILRCARDLKFQVEPVWV